MPKFNWAEPVAGAERAKDRFHRTATARMRTLADELGLEPGSYGIRSNKGGPAVSGEVTLHHEKVYVQASQPFGGGNGLLVRTCDGQRDYVGGRNHMMPLASLDDMFALAERIREIEPDLLHRPAMAMG